jgi:Arc/MetJ family transcription regulator
VYGWFMRTNIDIDDKLLAQAKKIAGTKTKKETVEYALRELIRRKQRRAIADLYGKVEWIGNLDESREGRVT